MENLKFKIFCGEENPKTQIQLHPIQEVKRAASIIESLQGGEYFSNSTDFVSTMYYLCRKNEYEIEFFINNVSVGSNIEAVFEDFNKALFLMDEITE